MSHRVLLVDDEPGILRALRGVLGNRMAPQLHAFAVRLELFDSPVLALQRARKVRFAAVVADYRMPEMNGVTLLTEMRELQPLAMRIVLSGYADMPVLVTAINEARIHCFLRKPWDDDELRAAVMGALVLHERLRECEEIADAARLQLGGVAPRERKLKRLEISNPVLTGENRGLTGSVALGQADDA